MTIGHEDTSVYKKVGSFSPLGERRGAGKGPFPTAVRDIFSCYFYIFCSRLQISRDSDKNDVVLSFQRTTKAQSERFTRKESK